MCPGAKMVDLGAVDLDELATALGDQGYFEHRWFDRSGQRGDLAVDGGRRD